MNVKVAVRNDGAVAVVTRIDGGWAYGYLLDQDGSKIDFEPPIASLISRGEWDALPGLQTVELSP